MHVFVCRKHLAESNQRHTAVMISSGGGLARLADAIWARLAEGIRRCAPGVGAVMEARTWCESGWRGSLPQEVEDLADAPTDSSQQQQFPSQEQEYETLEDRRQSNGRSSSRPPRDREDSRSRRPTLQPHDTGTDPNFRLPSYRSNADSSTSISDRYHSNRTHTTSSSTPLSQSRLSDQQDPVTTDRNVSAGTEELYSDYYAEAGEAVTGQGQALQNSITESLEQPGTANAIPHADASPQPLSHELRASPEPTLAAPGRATPLPRSRVNSAASRGDAEASHSRQSPLPTPPRSRDLDYRDRDRNQQHRYTNSYAAQNRVVSNPSPTRPSRSPGLQSQNLPSPNHSPRASRALPVTPGIYGRPITPLSPTRFGAPPTNLGLKPPKGKSSADSWVGKGLRRLSMPTFNGNDR